MELSKGGMDGVISVLETGKPPKDRFTKCVGSMKGTDKARCISWRASKLELMVSHENGQVAFWKIQNGQISRILFI